MDIYSKRTGLSPSNAVIGFNTPTWFCCKLHPLILVSADGCSLNLQHVGALKPVVKLFGNECV
jgi:hypothetical protein